MNQNPSLDEWTDVFKKCLFDLKEKYPKLSLSQLASKIEMARSTLNDHYNSKVGISKPSLDNYLKVVIESGNESILVKAMEAYDPKLSIEFKKLIAVSSSEENTSLTTSEQELALEDRSLFVLVVMAANFKGIEIDTARQVLGAKFQSALDSLIIKNFGFVNNDRIVLNHWVNLIRSFESAKYHLNTYSEYYKPHHVGKERNYVHSMTAALNKAGLKAMQEVHRQYHENLVKVLRDPKYSGNIPAFSVGYCDTFTDINSELDNSKEGLQ